MNDPPPPRQLHQAHGPKADDEADWAAAGVRIEAMSSDPWALCRWSRWVRRVHRCPPAETDPAGYLAAVTQVLTRDRFDALLATHEQTWLFALARDRLPDNAPVAVAPGG